MAVLYSQLKEMDDIKSKREKKYIKYRNKLKPFLNFSFIDNISEIPENRNSNYHIFYIKFKKNRIRDIVLNKLQNRGISASFHYIPLHSSPMGKKLGYKPEDLDFTREVGATILRLPLYPELKEKQLIYILENIAEIFKDIEK